MPAGRSCSSIPLRYVDVAGLQRSYGNLPGRTPHGWVIAEDPGVGGLVLRRFLRDPCFAEFCESSRRTASLRACTRRVSAMWISVFVTSRTKPDCGCFGGHLADHVGQVAPAPKCLPGTLALAPGQPPSAHLDRLIAGRAIASLSGALAQSTVYRRRRRTVHGRELRLLSRVPSASASACPVMGAARRSTRQSRSTRVHRP